MKTNENSESTPNSAAIALLEKSLETLKQHQLDCQRQIAFYSETVDKYGSDLAAVQKEMADVISALLELKAIRLRRIVFPQEEKQDSPALHGRARPGQGRPGRAHCISKTADRVDAGGFRASHIPFERIAQFRS